MARHFLRLFALDYLLIRLCIELDKVCEAFKFAVNFSVAIIHSYLGKVLFALNEFESTVGYFFVHRAHTSTDCGI